MRCPCNANDASVNFCVLNSSTADCTVDHFHLWQMHKNTINAAVGRTFVAKEKIVLSAVVLQFSIICMSVYLAKPCVFDATFMPAHKDGGKYGQGHTTQMLSCSLSFLLTNALFLDIFNAYIRLEFS